MKQRLPKLLLLISVMLVLIILRQTGLYSSLTMEQFSLYRDTLLDTVQRQYLLSAIIFIVIYIVVTAFSIPGATVMTLAGGFLFGAFQGALYVNAGATLGATLAFLFSRYLIGTHIQTKFEQQLLTFNRELSENGVSFMLTLRLIPLFPFFLINLLAGLTKMPVIRFMWTTSIGILPGSLVYTYAGQQIGTIESIRDIFSAKVLLAFTLLGLFALIPTLIKKIRNSRKEI